MKLVIGDWVNTPNGRATVIGMPVGKQGRSYTVLFSSSRAAVYDVGVLTRIDDSDSNLSAGTTAGGGSVTTGGE